MTDDKYLNILHSCKVAEIATRNGRMRDAGNKECITEERANCQQWLFFGSTNQDDLRRTFFRELLIMRYIFLIIFNLILSRLFN
jgi:hypothetical protein